MEMVVDFELVTCCQCSIIFAITAGHESNLRKCHNDFYCPAGHSQYYPQETVEERLKKEIKLKNMEIEKLKKDSKEKKKRRRKK